MKVRWSSIAEERVEGKEGEEVEFIQSKGKEV
jgi:hypothetical protein